jgi:hypothetical protein
MLLGGVLVGALGAGDAAAQRYVPGSDEKHPRIQYADSLVSVNDRCIVSSAKLNLRMRATYANGRPIGYC